MRQTIPDEVLYEYYFDTYIAPKLNQLLASRPECLGAMRPKELRLMVV